MLVVECIEPDVSPIDIMASRDIWIYDVKRDSPIKLPVDRGSESDPVWSPDGTQIFFSSDAWDGNGSDIYRTDQAGSEFECVLDDPGYQWVMGWYPGKNLVYVNDRLSIDVSYSLRMLEGSKSIELVKEAGDGQIFSNHLLYYSDTTGEAQIYVKSLESSQVWNISKQGGHKPRWRPDGKEIFYLSPDQKLMAVPISWDHGFKPGNPESLFEMRIASPEGSGMRNPFAVTKDGQRFVIYLDEASSSLNIVINAIPQ